MKIFFFIILAQTALANEGQGLQNGRYGTLDADCGLNITKEEVDNEIFSLHVTGVRNPMIGTPCREPLRLENGIYTCYKNRNLCLKDFGAPQQADCEIEILSESRFQQNCKIKRALYEKSS